MKVNIANSKVAILWRAIVWQMSKKPSTHAASAWRFRNITIKIFPADRKTQATQ
jgi:hypothetical protein